MVEDGFKFTITLLAAFGSIFISIYSLFQNIAVEIHLYELVSKLIAVALILIIYLILYVYIRGLSFETESTIFRIWCNSLASFFYSLVFIGGLYLFIFIFLGSKSDLLWWGSTIFFIFILVIILFASRSEYRSGDNIFYPNWRIIVPLLVAILVSVQFWYLLYPIVLSSPLQGHITSDMESIYYKNDVPIPVSIKVTGLNPGLFINLSQVNSEKKLIQIDSIKLESIHNPEKTVQSKNSTLYGNAMEFGKYNLFINTTNLTIGYYELVSLRNISSMNEEYIFGFYLSDKN